ncbi:hypothetical protein CYMTET_10077 [Cymbomonas tetramitiformis]|uniref:Uncharacterized protein n=1 Tax=Cymbomonas tetramitiformis TaxID=36881 RepID=A0AAE0GQD2_9CHLO|nr:hypothetical protein CYMTET_10077 [Cymbomonas tetramitiformis]
MVALTQTARFPDHPEVTALWGKSTRFPDHPEVTALWGKSTRFPDHPEVTALWGKITWVGVDVIFGVNGRVWVGAHVEAPAADTGTPHSAEDEAEKITRPPVKVDAEVREKVCRVANAIQVLAKLFFPIHAPAVLQTYQDSLAADVQAKDMLGDYFQTYVLEKEVERRVLASS